MLESVNFHLWEPCNMRCKFCFATFKDVRQTILPKGHLPKKEAVKVVQELAKLGFKKITFAGGEPTLCSWLPELIQEAKKLGLTTMIVTNGTKLTENFLRNLQNSLDWIALSIDSLDDKTNIETGRAIAGKKSISINEYKNLIDLVKKYRYGLKINTVISKTNYKQDLSELIKYAKPIRWKVFQVLPIKGQNDKSVDSFKISDEEFSSFNVNHGYLKNTTTIICESNSDMKSSYAMVDPAGRFYDNTKGEYNYSQPILKIGAENAIKEVNYSNKKFIKRGGIYDWEINKKESNKTTYEN